MIFSCVQIDVIESSMVRCRFLSGCNTVLIAGSNDPVATLKPSSQTLRNRLNDLDIWPHNHVESPHLVALLNLDKIALPSGFTIKMHQGMAPEAKEPTKTKVWSPVSGFGLPWDDIWICDMWDFGYVTRIRNYLYSFWAFKREIYSNWDKSFSHVLQVCVNWLSFSASVSERFSVLARKKTKRKRKWKIKRTSEIFTDMDYRSLVASTVSQILEDFDTEMLKWQEKKDKKEKKRDKNKEGAIEHLPCNKMSPVSWGVETDWEPTIV